MKKLLSFILLLCLLVPASAEDGNRLWLRYTADGQANVTCNRQSPIVDAAAAELRKGWKGVPVALTLIRNKETRALGEEGFRLSTSDERGKISITSAGERGLLYGAFHLLRLQETGTD